MIDHLALYTTSELHQKTVEFYVRTLEPLGYKKMMEFQDGKIVGLGDGTGNADFWLAVLETEDPKQKLAHRQLGYAHYAFRTNDRKAVDTAYANGIEAGGKDYGPPGPRPNYGPNYYAGFIYDPMGYGMEIICRSPPE